MVLTVGALVGAVQLVDVKTVTTVVLLIYHRCNSGAFDCRSAIPLLSVQGLAITTAPRINRVEDQISRRFVIATGCMTVCQSVTSRVVAEICLVHKLVVEGRVATITTR